MDAARYLHIAPWQLLEQPDRTFWISEAIRMKNADNHAREVAEEIAKHRNRNVASYTFSNSTEEDTDGTTEIRPDENR